MYYSISRVYSKNLFSNKFISQIEEFNYDNPNADVLFKIIFLDFVHYEEKEAVKGICENRIHTNRIHTILSEKIDYVYKDDNGVYLNSRSSKRMYHMDIDKKSITVSSHVVHQEGCAYYYNQRCGGRAYDHTVVPEREFYFLERYYRESKSIPVLKRMVVRAKSISTQSYEKLLHCLLT